MLIMQPYKLQIQALINCNIYSISHSNTTFINTYSTDTNSVLLQVTGQLRQICFASVILQNTLLENLAMLS
jgi:hypothetical protein